VVPPTPGVGGLARQLGSGLNHAHFVSEDHRLRAVMDFELLKDVLYLRFDGPFCQKQTVRDL